MKTLKSRKLILAVLTTLSVWASVLFGVDLDVNQLAAIVSPVVAYILGQAWVDAKQA